MTKPIAQTFYINEPIGGVEGIVLTRLDVYFQSVSDTYGVEIQIRQTDNGNPTPNIVNRASKVLHVGDTYATDMSYLDTDGVTLKTITAGTKIIRASSDATVPTIFEFDTPIPLQSQTTYAFVVIPLGGNPDYTIWTSELGGTDVSTNTPVYTNNDTGTLFLSSNDIQFTSILTEDIKFVLWTADFTSTSGMAVFNPYPEERVLYTDLVGSFVPNEVVYISNNAFNLAKLTINSNTGAFTVGETVYQSNGSANNATGKVFSANTTSILITNSYGAWVTSPGSNTYQVVGATSSAYANTSAVNQNVISYSNSTLIVPFTGNSTANVFYANQSLYVGTNSRSTVDVVYVNTVVNSTTLKLSGNLSFSDSSSILGQLRGDKLSLNLRYSGPQAADPVLRFGQTIYRCWLYSKEDVSTVQDNFSNSYGQYIIGFLSKASGLCVDTTDLAYNAIIPEFTTIESKSTAIDFTFKGIDNSNTYDSVGISVTNGTEKELLDKPRLIKSRSHDILENSSNSSITLTAFLGTSNNKISPVIDGMTNNIRFIRNLVGSANQVQGFYASISNTHGPFKGGLLQGDYVSQNTGSVTVTGQVVLVNPTALYIANVSSNVAGINPGFQSGYSIYKTTNNQVNTTCTGVVEFNEKYSANVFPGLPRYISKSVVLAENQDAEDLKVFLTAYRPACTNFQVYGKFLHNQDPDTFSSKIWSRLSENTASQALISSGSNQDDFVELVYELPSSALLIANSITCSNTSANVTVSTTSGISNGSFIYLYNSSSNNFIVRQVNNVVNNTLLVLKSNSSFSSSNADIGIINGLEHQTGAFVNANNNGIIRYVSSTDVVFDSYKTFAIKIVPTAENSSLVPRAGDYRALALQV